MKRIILTAAAVLALTSSAALAQQQPPEGFEYPERPSTDRPELQQPERPQQPAQPEQPQRPEVTAKDLSVFRGEIVSVDAEGGTITADAEELSGSGGTSHSESGSVSSSSDEEQQSGSRTTFAVDGETIVARDGKASSLDQLRKNDLIHVAIVHDADASPDEVLATPAWVVSAHSKVSFYGFAGRVVGVDTEASTITLNVRYTTPAGRRALGGSSGRATFKVGPETHVLLNGKPAELKDISAGDMAGVGIWGGRRASMEEISATPVDVVMASDKGKVSRKRSARYAKSASRKAKRIYRAG